LQLHNRQQSTVKLDSGRILQSGINAFLNVAQPL